MFGVTIYWQRRACLGNSDSDLRSELLHCHNRPLFHLKTLSMTKNKSEQLHYCYLVQALLSGVLPGMCLAWFGLKEDIIVGELCWRTDWEEEHDLIILSSVLPCCCVCLNILPDVVTSVCRRCVERVAMVKSKNQSDTLELRLKLF